MARGRWTSIDLVREELRQKGFIAAKDAIYSMTDPDGGVHRITRLAAIIHTLRHRDGWLIDTLDKPGHLAVYVLRARPYQESPAGRTPTMPQEPTGRPQAAPDADGAVSPPAPEPLSSATVFARGQYECLSCERPQPDAPWSVMLGGYATGRCGTCDKRTTWRLVVAPAPSTDGGGAVAGA